MLAIFLAVLNAAVVFVNTKTLRLYGLDILPFIVLLTDSVSIMGLAVVLHILADLHAIDRSWMVATAALIAGGVGLFHVWMGLLTYYVATVVFAYYTGLLGGRFGIFFAVNVTLNGLLVVLFA